MKRYHVISKQTPSGPEYRIYDTVNECTLEGGFDTQRWAESFADFMNKQEEEKLGRKETT